RLRAVAVPASTGGRARARGRGAPPPGPLVAGRARAVLAGRRARWHGLLAAARLLPPRAPVLPRGAVADTSAQRAPRTGRAAVPAARGGGSRRRRPGCRAGAGRPGRGLRGRAHA